MGTENPTPVEARAAARVAELGALLGDQVASMTDQLDARLAASIDELQGDDRLLALLRASIESNLENLVHLMRHAIPAQDATAPSAAMEYARRLAQRGISSTALIRAYRLGQHHIVAWAFEEFRAMEPELDVALEADRRFADFTFRYVDAVSEQVVGEYESERERWLSNRNTLRTAAVETLLEGGHVNIATAEQATGYRLRQHHVGVVLWGIDGHEGVIDLALLEEALTEVARAAGCSGRALFLPRERSLAWGWLPLGRAMSTLDLAGAGDRVHELSTGLRVAVGTAGADTDGFRSTHFEAQRARLVSVASGDAADPITSYERPEVRTAALLARDPETARELVSRALGELAVDTEGAARLRETLRVFLEERGSYAATAQKVHLHKNTVKYRVDRAVEERGRPLDEERLELELALLACHLLGSTVLR